MARRRWGGSIATAVGVAAGAGAAQLGFGYGLGIINWAAADVAGDQTAWVASLAWATWIAGTSTITGAVCAQRLRHRNAGGATPVAPDAEMPGAGPPGAEVSGPVDPLAGDRPGGALAASGPAGPSAGPGPAGPAAVSAPADAATEPADPHPVDPPGADGPAPARAGAGRDGDGGFAAAALALAGGFGALITVLLVAVPARVATIADVSAPQAVAAAYAGVGVLLGVLMASWVLRSPAAAANVIATIGWLWLLAVVAVVDGVLAGRGLTTAQLGIWQLSADRPGFWLQDWFYWPGAFLALASALLIGALTARRGARSPQHRLGAVASGVAGPLLVALAYLLATPGLADIGRAQVSAHLVAPYAVVAGLAGSMLTAALAQRAAARRTGPGRQTLALGVGVPVAVPRQRAGATDDAPARPATALATTAGTATTGPADESHQSQAAPAGRGGRGRLSAARRAKPGPAEPTVPGPAEPTVPGAAEPTTGPGGTGLAATAGGTEVTAAATGPGGADGLPEGGDEAGAAPRPPTTPKPRAGRRAR